MDGLFTAQRIEAGLRYDPSYGADAERDLTALLKTVQAGVEVVIERDAQPLAIIRAAGPARPMISDCIGLAGSRSGLRSRR